MSAIDRLFSNYSRQVRLPWSANMAGKQRVWFAVYPPVEERRVRARLAQFETVTLEANHGWVTVWSGRIDGLCSALQMTKKYPIDHPFDLEWAREFKEQYRGVLEAF